MKVGTKLVKKNTGSEYRITDVRHAVLGTPLYRVALRGLTIGDWRTEEYIKNKFYVLGDSATPEPQPVEKLELGDIVVGKASKRRKEVIATDGGKVKLYDLELGEVTGFENTMHYTLPTRHRFYVENNTLHCDPPLKLVDGVHDALGLAIRKWEVLAGHDGVVDNPADDCALCQKYNPDRRVFSCDECPIMRRSGSHGCKDTWYTNYANREPGAAQKMLDFLKSLREPEFEVGDLVTHNEYGGIYRISDIVKWDYNIAGIGRRCSFGGVPKRLLSPFTGHHFYLDSDNVLQVVPALTGDEPNSMELSIQKWERIVELLEDGEEVWSDNHNTCALCAKHAESSCYSCPIATFVGSTTCTNTPYTWFTKSGSLAAAQAELAFLREVKERHDND